MPHIHTLNIPRQMNYAPTLLVDIHTRVNVLTSKIKFVILFHGKPPLAIYVLAD